MARGWESKSVESQVESAEVLKGDGEKERRDPAALVRLRKKEGLLLSRLRVVHGLETARSPRYREILQMELRHLEDALAELENEA